MLRFTTRKTYAWIILFVLVCSRLGATDWQPVLRDRFARAALGSDWRILRGDWRIEDGKLRITRQWPSDSVIMCTKAVRHPNVMVALEVTLGEKDTMRLQLRSGEILWGGGGILESFGIALKGVPADAITTTEEKDPWPIEINKPHRVQLQIRDGQARATVDGQTVTEREIAEARSEVNVYFAVNCLPNGTIDEFALMAIPDVMGAEPVALRKAPKGQNTKATVDADAYIKRARNNPAIGIQNAINSLPNTGGVVILPEGEFLMRRHVQLRSNVSLRGQGPQTVLIAPSCFSTGIREIEEQNGQCLLTVADGSGLQPGDSVCYGPTWGHPGTVGVGPGGGNRGVTVLAVDGNTVTVTEPPPGKIRILRHWFPLIYARQAEFVEVKDLTLRGAVNTDFQVRFTHNPFRIDCFRNDGRHGTKVLF